MASLSLTVIIATKNRARQLERTLICLQQQRLPEVALKAVVVDNGSSDDTAFVLRKTWPGIDVTPLYEAVAGKSRSLNRALAAADGDLLVFTDDDISAGPEWLNELTQAAARFPHACIFCGPIIPAYPKEVPDWIRHHPKAGAFFGVFQPRETEGPLPENILPFGANFAVRRRAISGMEFRLELGPSAENGPLLGEDTEFLSRVRRASGADCIYVPGAAVRHHLTPSQLQPASIFERAFHLGRTRAALVKSAVLVSRSRVEPPTAVPPDPIELGALLNFHCGQIAGLGESTAMAKARFEAVITQLGIGCENESLSQSASKYIALLR